jgi:hypothetical protein
MIFPGSPPVLQLTANSRDGRPAWSRSGNLIAFVRSAGAPGRDIAAVMPAGEGEDPGLPLIACSVDLEDDRVGVDEVLASGERLGFPT